jgi:hypothetical protein
MIKQEALTVAHLVSFLARGSVIWERKEQVLHLLSFFVSFSHFVQSNWSKDDFDSFFFFLPLLWTFSSPLRSKDFTWHNEELVYCFLQLFGWVFLCLQFSNFQRYFPAQDMYDRSIFHPIPCSLYAWCSSLKTLTVPIYTLPHARFISRRSTRPSFEHLMDERLGNSSPDRLIFYQILLIVAKLLMSTSFRV